MRLIDADAADVERICCYYGGNCYIEDVQEWLDEQPTIDAVEVVRCKDCMHRYSARCPMCVKTTKGVIIWEATTDDGFCLRGVKIDGGAEGCTN